MLKGGGQTHSAVTHAAGNASLGGHGSNVIIGVNLNKWKQNCDQQKPFGLRDQELMGIDLCTKKSEWFKL